ncbi:hypothetical protein BX666DRAFT_992103 [Dichotomocladium elegans]|nr:hypothetical protein BX666DRAFT_992103 [Dichotomocladium elegans]
MWYAGRIGFTVVFVVVAVATSRPIEIEEVIHIGCSRKNSLPRWKPRPTSPLSLFFFVARVAMSDSLVEAILNYCELLDEAASPRVATWRPYFIERCAHWCVFIETELIALPNHDAIECLRKAQQQAPNKRSIPSLDTLSNSLRHLLSVLMKNIYVSNDLYWHILSTYDLYNPNQSPRQLLLEDISNAVNEAASLNVLDMLTLWYDILLHPPHGSQSHCRHYYFAVQRLLPRVQPARAF